MRNWCASISASWRNRKPRPKLRRPRRPKSPHGPRLLLVRPLRRGLPRLRLTARPLLRLAPRVLQARLRARPVPRPRSRLLSQRRPSRQPLLQQVRRNLSPRPQNLARQLLGILRCPLRSALQLSHPDLLRKLDNPRPVPVLRLRVPVRRLDQGRRSKASVHPCAPGNHCNLAPAHHRACALQLHPEDRKIGPARRHKDIRNAPALALVAQGSPPQVGARGVSAQAVGVQVVRGPVVRVACQEFRKRNRENRSTPVSLPHLADVR